METKRDAPALNEFPQNNVAVLITAEEFARMLSISPRTLWRLLSAGKLVRPIRVGGSTRWRTEDVRSWIEAGCPAVDHDP